ncbi:MAG TPA: hypothetical protein DFR83_01310 [Deltaproteobacteria bacterium]|nr:hypothetical protein [Deltaproteobacteria bacterium]
MGEFALAIKALLEPVIAKVLDLFSLLDLSFFVPGGIAMFGLIMAVPDAARESIEEVAPAGLLAGGFLATYVLGIVCFGSARFFRRSIFPGFKAVLWSDRDTNTERLERNLKGSGHYEKVLQMLGRDAPSDSEGVAPPGRFPELDAPLVDDPHIEDPSVEKDPRTKIPPTGGDAAGTVDPAGVQAADFVRRTQETAELSKDELWQVYGRMWVVIREDDSLGNSFSHINGLWIRAAILDGLCAALLLWALLACQSPEQGTLLATILPDARWGVAVVLAVGAGCAWLEASRCREHQIYEIVSTWSFAMDRRQGS